MGDANTYPPTKLPSESAEAARERRLRALRSLAAGQGVGPTGDAPQQRPPSAPRIEAESSAETDSEANAYAPRQATRRPRHTALWVSVATVIICGAVVAAGALYTHEFPGRGVSAHATTPAIPSFSFNMQQDNTTCFADAAWAPDSQSVAVLGYANSCPLINTNSAGVVETNTVVQIIHVGSGQRLQIHPDTFVHIPRAAIIQYEDVLWSPDSRRIALPFLAETLVGDPAAGPQTIAPLAIGLLLVNADGIHPQVLSQPASAFNVEFGPALNGFLASSEEWDLATGTLVVRPRGQLTGTAFHWGANGQLMSIPGARAQAVGQPDGGASFTIWQPGAVQVGLTSSSAVTNQQFQAIPGLELLETSFGAWSPDGRYLYAPFSINRRIQLPRQPTPPTTIPNELVNDTSLSTAPHDRVLATLYTQLYQQANTIQEYYQTTLPAVSVAWRPDGQVIATQAQTGVGVDTVTLYDCATGHTITQLTHDTIFGEQAVGSQPLLRWSPDGKYLALTNSQYDTLIIWAIPTSLH